MSYSTKDSMRYDNPNKYHIDHKLILLRKEKIKIIFMKYNIK